MRRNSGRRSTFCVLWNWFSGKVPQISKIFSEQLIWWGDVLQMMTFLLGRSARYVTYFNLHSVVYLFRCSETFLNNFSIPLLPSQYIFKFVFLLFYQFTLLTITDLLIVLQPPIWGENYFSQFDRWKDTALYGRSGASAHQKSICMILLTACFLLYCKVYHWSSSSCLNRHSFF